MLQLGRDLDLALEPLAIDARRQLGRQHLDHDLAAECVLGRRENAAHPAANELVAQAVGGSQRCGQSFAEVVSHGCGAYLGKVRSSYADAMSCVTSLVRHSGRSNRAVVSRRFKGSELLNS